MAAYLLAAVVGLAVGRFLSVVVAAGPTGGRLSPAVGFRPACGYRAGRWDLLPVWWWVRNRGRRWPCGAPAGVALPLVEPVTAGVFGAIVHFVGPVWSLPAYLWFASVTVVLGFIDLGHRLIPNRILIPGTFVGGALLTGAAILEGRVADLPEALATGVGYFGALLVPALLTKGAIGMGDVKLAFLLGLFSGYGNWEAAVLAGAGAFVLAGMAAVLLLAFRVIGRADHLPFGPFMVTAAWISIALDLASSGTGLT